MILYPNCKINIGLNIVGRRPDGYHDIETVMVPVDWHDILEIVPGKGSEDRLTCTGRKVDCPPEKNLVMKAVRLLRSHVVFPPVDIYLRKIIPDGAGLGGGSADATFTLRGINELFSLGLDNGTLEQIASKIGADCPMFVENKPVYATGIGTTFSDIDVNLAGMKIMIVKPPVNIPTAEAYSQVMPAPASSPHNEDVKLPVADWKGLIKNDFEPSVARRYPVIAAIKEMLYRCGAMYAAMSGSGSAVFGLFEGDKLSVDMGRLFPNCDIFCGDMTLVG